MAEVSIERRFYRTKLQSRVDDCQVLITIECAMIDEEIS